MDCLKVPEMLEKRPIAGIRVKQTLLEYKKTNVYHSLYLPTDWKNGYRYPVIVEYTGNYFPPTGSTGKVEDANLGYGLSKGEKFIWLVLPYISKNHKYNEIKWWGDEIATVNYCKKAIKFICDEYGGDPSNLFICGFSRGAIGVNYIGLYDDEIAKLWKGFITNDHYDGIEEWCNTYWGYPLEKYREDAKKRLKRIKNRPVLIMQNNSAEAVEKIKTYVSNSVDDSSFDYLYVPINKLFSKIPNSYFETTHTDKWLLFENEYATKVRDWINNKVMYNK